ncbi:MAG: hypothetical protein KKA73_01065 [Chloroflexi bacterium]|nr:hypothetical protein [Chloroflexota bacterium]MBU1746254.1 hypothetical protein [Chloroflexota bacterium]MBU1879067.1 hypothetical protein [Chloroflexota bacterium]
MTAEPNWWGNMDPLDDAWHLATAGTFSEWWYFDARLDQGYSPAEPGYALSVAFQIQGVAPDDPVPSMRATLFEPDATPRYLVYDGTPADFQAAHDVCDVRMGASWLRGAPPRYEMHAELEDLTADLTLTSLVPAWKHWDWCITPNRGKGFFGWTVAVPMGRVEGTLRIGSQTVHVTGRGYRDKCWMGGPIFGHFDRWYTGRLHADDTAIVYYVIPRRGRGARGIDFLNACAVFRNGQLAYEVHPETANLVQFVIAPDEQAVDPATKRAYPVQQTLEPPENPVIGPITLHTDAVTVRAVPLPANMNWLRRQIAKRIIKRATIKCLGTWEAEWLGNKRPRRVTGEAISEIVYLR